VLPTFRATAHRPHGRPAFGPHRRDEPPSAVRVVEWPGGSAM
ncbi:MAG: hypothetical protein AVDCRST_MAG70-741, partial [uncultured Thermomicrobiales bacterium]